MRTIQLLLLSVLFFSSGIYSQTATNKTGTSKNYSNSTTQKPTYNVNGTKYINGETYKTTGQPKVDRSEAAKHEFLESKGYKEVPYGYQVDHIIPLSQGGKDIPSNMQLLTIEQHKQKTASERKQAKYYSSKTYNNYSTSKTRSTSYKSSSYTSTSLKKSSNSSKSPSYNYSVSKSSNNSYKAPSYKYSTPKTSYNSKSYSSGGRRK